MPQGYCTVPHCDKFGDNDLRSIYFVPSAPKHSTPAGDLRLRRRKKWLGAIGLKDKAEDNNLAVCSRHFVSGKPALIGNTEDVDWAPTLFLPDSIDNAVSAVPNKKGEALEVELDISQDLSSQGEAANFDVCNERKTIMESTQNPSPRIGEDVILDGEVEGQCDEQIMKSDRVVIGNALMSEVKSENSFNSVGDDGNYENQLKDKYRDLANKYRLLQGQLEDKNNLFDSLEKEHLVLLDKLREDSARRQSFHLDEEYFVGNDAKTLYFTGLPTYDLLMVMFGHVKDHIKVSCRSALNAFQQYVSTLMRLRLNVDFKFLSYIFNASEETVSRISHAVIHVMYVRYECLISWPSRENLIASMPLPFKETFGCKVAVIIDCFEVVMESPSNKHASAQMYSQYKKNPTSKFLLAICPQGAITYVSSGYGGRSSDKYITESCGFVDELLPGDIVLADRGFTVHELILTQKAEILMPAFKKRGAPQMDPRDVETSRRISNLRIHIERVIGVLKGRFKVWSSRLPTNCLERV